VILHQITNDLQQIEQTNVYALAISVAVLVAIVGSKQISKKIPGALITVIGSIVVSWAFNLEAHGVHVLGAIPSGLPKIGLPDVHWDPDLIMKLLPTAFAMFVVILAQSAATSRAYAARHHRQAAHRTHTAPRYRPPRSAGSGSHRHQSARESAGRERNEAGHSGRLVTPLCVAFSGHEHLG